MKNLRIWKLWEEARMPTYGTEWSACFDLSASLRDGDEVTVYTVTNVQGKRHVYKKSIPLASGERMLVPTGLVFDLDEGESIRLHPRSGLSLKDGIVLANAEGVIDADYVNQSYIMLTNVSSETFKITDGMRICQGEVVAVEQRNFVLADCEPETKTSRNGGYGSTGVA